MRRRKTPPEKKALSYDRHRVSIGAKARHTFRKSWLRKKALAQRAYRRKLQAEAGALRRGVNLDAATSLPQHRRRRVRKWPAPTLQEWIENRRRKRHWSQGAKALRRLRHDESLQWYCDFLLHRFVRDLHVSDTDDLSDVIGYAWSKMRSQLPVSRPVWEGMFKKRREWLPLLKAWRRRATKELQRVERRRRTRG